jgi:hypothetical protein
MDKVTSLRGPVEKIDGVLMIRIPLGAGGSELQKSCRGISEIEGDFLKIIIQNWLAEKLGLRDGSIVAVDNQEGKFNIQLSTDQPEV